MRITLEECCRTRTSRSWPSMHAASETAIYNHAAWIIADAIEANSFCMWNTFQRYSIRKNTRIREANGLSCGLGQRNCPCRLTCFTNISSGRNQKTSQTIADVSDPTCPSYSLDGTYTFLHQNVSLGLIHYKFVTSVRRRTFSWRHFMESWSQSWKVYVSSPYSCYERDWLNFLRPTAHRHCKVIGANQRFHIAFCGLKSYLTTGMQAYTVAWCSITREPHYETINTTNRLGLSCQLRGPMRNWNITEANY
jgi:hypothetical protein